MIVELKLNVPDIIKFCMGVDSWQCKLRFI